MNPLARTLVPMLLAVAAVESCVGSTGGGIVSFKASAAGPTAIATKGSYAFDNALGYHVALTRANVYVGAVYLRRVRAVGLARPTSCVVPGTYVAQLTSPLLVDALDPTPQPFPAAGEGVVDHALTAEVWLSGVRVDQDDDTTVVLDVAGTATKGSGVYPFDGALTIGKNRLAAPEDPAEPGANPVCRQRIVAPIDTDFETSAGGELTLRIDPKVFFGSVDFAQLEGATATTAGATYHFRNVNAGQPDLNLFNGLRSRVGAYDLSWTP